MSKFNTNIQYGVVKFPNESKWSVKAKNTGYKTVIIGDCEWFAEDLIEVLDSPVYLPDLTDVSSIAAYNNNTDSTKLHEIAFIDPKINPGSPINCTQFWKFIPTNQTSLAQEAALLADTDPVIPAGTLPCFFKSQFKNESIVDSQPTKILYNYRAAKLIIKNLPKELKEEGWKLPDDKDIYNLITAVHKIVNGYNGNDLTTITNLSALEKQKIQKALTSELNHDIYTGFSTKSTLTLNPATYSVAPTTADYDTVANDTAVDKYNITGFSAIFQGAVGTCGIYVYGNNVVSNGSSLPNNFNSLSGPEKTLWLIRQGLAVNYWGQTVGSTGVAACTYDANTLTGLTCIDGCSSTSFSYSQITGFSLYAWTATQSGNNVTINKNNNLTISNLTSSGANSIRLCRKLPFKIKQNRNLSLENTVSNNTSYTPSTVGTNSNVSRYIVSPQLTNPASDCIQHIVFDIKNNFGGTRILKGINFRDNPLSTDLGNSNDIEFTTTVNFAFKLEKVSTSNVATTIASNTYTITTNNSFTSNANPPSFKITLNTVVILNLNESIRVTLPANFGIVNNSNDVINWHPIINLDTNDADKYSGNAAADTDWKTYKVPKNTPVLLNKITTANNNTFSKYGGQLNIPNFDIGYTLSGYSGSTINYYDRRGSGISDGYFPIIALKPILADEFNNWDPGVNISSTSNIFIQNFLALTNPQNYNFTPNDPFIFDLSQSGFIEYRIPNPTVNTLSWNIELLGDILANSSDFTFKWINAETAVDLHTGLTYTHHPDTTVKLKIEWAPSSAYVINDTGYNCRISPLNCNLTTGAAKYGWDILLTGESTPSGPSADIICDTRSIPTNPDPLILNPGVAANFTISVPYVNGNGIAFTIPSVSSTGVTGLTIASLSGTLINGSGTLVFSVTGTPSAAGTALFNLDIFDNEICPLAYTVQDIIPNDFNNSDGCPGQEVIFYNYNCDIVEDVTNITVDGIAVSGFQVSTVTNPCQIQFTIPLNVSINRSVQVKFYDGASELESLPFFIKPCGGNYFNPDSTTGSPGCSNITFTNSDCSIIDKLDSITFEGVEAEYYIIQNSSPCKIGISIPDFKPRAGFPTYATVSFNGADGRSILTESYLVTAGCDGRTDDVTEPDLTCGEIQLLSSDNLTFLDCNNNPIRFEEGEPFTKTGWTISFSTELGVWSSRHTYQPYMYMYNSKGMYTLTKIVDTDSLWKHTEKATRLSYYGDNQSKFEVDMIFPGEDKRTTTGTSTTKNTNKIFSAFAVSSDSFEEDLNLMRNKFNIPFNQFYVYNSFQISGLVDINYLENLRRVDGSWVINEFRDLAKYGNISDGLAQLSPGLGEQMFLSEGEINNNYIDNNKNWYNKRKFVDKWIGLRLIYNPAITSNVDLVYLYNVVFNSRPSFR